MSDYVLDLSGIRKTYRGGVEALKGIDLQVPRGCIYGLLASDLAVKIGVRRAHISCRIYTEQKQWSATFD